MKSKQLPMGSRVRIDKRQLQVVIERLAELGYRVVGPQVRDQAVVCDDLDSIEQLPIGVQDHQDAGCYRLVTTGNDRYFDCLLGPHSLKTFLLPAEENVLTASREEGDWLYQTAEMDPQPLAVIGVRACDLRALRIADNVFLRRPHADPAYRRRREHLALIAVQCCRAVSTCFCHSLDAGPIIRGDFDLALTELDDRFVIEVGSILGGQIVAACEWSPCAMEDIRVAREQAQRLQREMNEQADATRNVLDAPMAKSRKLDTNNIRDLLLNNLEHDHWDEVAQRCLACGNCTLVCPTCFCCDVREVSDLHERRVERRRVWASCFTTEHSYMNSGTVRKTIRSRYRQWLTHKLASWIDQFGTSGCTGCGRCITWCPVGIDLTEEVAAIRGTKA